jgi:hypothetical protein
LPPNGGDVSYAPGVTGKSADIVSPTITGRDCASTARLSTAWGSEPPKKVE